MDFGSIESGRKLCKMSLAAIFVFVCFLHSAKTQIPNETVYQDFACYGTINGQMDANCTSGSKIAPIRVIAGTKLNATGCPASSTNASFTNLCCRLDSTNDCTGEYENVFSPNETYIYHMDCVGLQQCPGRAATRMDRSHLSCSGNNSYRTQTIYMYLNYHCILDSKIGIIISSSVSLSVMDGPLYLMGQSYPNPISVTSASCSVESDDCSATIQTWLIDLRLDDVISGTCTQSLNISGTVIECTDNNDFQIRSIHQAMDNYLEVHFASSVNNAASGSGDTMTLNCPAVSPQHSCTTTTEESTTTESSTTEVTTVYNVSTELDNDTAPVRNKEDNAGLIAGSVVGGVIFIAIIVGVGVFIYWKCCRGKNAKDNRTSQQKTERSTATLMKVSLAHKDKSDLNLRRSPGNLLPPLLKGPTDDGIKVGPSETEQRKKRKKTQKSSKEQSQILNGVNEHGEIILISEEGLHSEKRKKKKKKKKKKKVTHEKEGDPGSIGVDTKVQETINGNGRQPMKTVKNNEVPQQSQTDDEADKVENPTNIFQEGTVPRGKEEKHRENQVCPS